MRNVPKLRFKEFTDEWEEKKLGEISLINAGGDIKKENFSEEKTDEFKFSVYANSLDKEGLYGYSNIFKITGESITVTARGNIGVATYRNENYVPIVRLLVIKMDSTKYSHKYFSYFINTIKIIQEVTGVPQLTAPQLKGYKVIYPISLREQQKIADFLSNVDKKISITEEKLNLFNEYKKGIMQKIFNQELRFKDENGNDYPEWEEKKLEDLPIYLSDGNYGELYPKQEELLTYGIPFIRVNNLVNSRITFNDMKYISADLHKILLSGHLLEGDILISTRGEIGLTAYVDCRFNDANINAQLCLLRIENKNNLDNKFLLHTLNSYEVKKQYKELQTGSALKQLPKKNLLKILIKLPCIKEQQKIADFLSAIDTKIERISDELENLKEFKKGLLQQMFV